MNFDFLKDVPQLKYVYENCSNAEKLAMTMPVQSVFTSRKSAELLAKFIYLASHNEKMETMNFVDILGDPTFRDFIRDREVMKAFHAIRKNGNRAVHSDDEETSEDAIDVLEDLHFVTGETACMLGLIDGYPSFDYSIESHPEAKYVEEQEIEKKVQEMFSQYVTQYNAQVERDNYYKNNIESLIDDYDSLSSQFVFSPGYVDLNEEIEFKNKPVYSHSIKPIQSHFGFLGIRALKKQRGALVGTLEDRDVEFSGELTIYGENGYTTSDLRGFIEGVLHDLPSSDGFKIVSKYYGPSIAPWFDANKDVRETPEDDTTVFVDEIIKIGQLEKFTYKFHEFYYDHGAGWSAKYENGVLSPGNYSDAILDKDYGKDWWCWMMFLDVSFDYEKHPEIVRAIHDTVRKRVPEEELQYCEEAWEEGNEGIICNNITWEVRRLRTIQDFLDEINEILKPIMDECDGSGEGSWFIKESPFAVATWSWTDEGFKITGAEL